MLKIALKANADFVQICDTSNDHKRNYLMMIVMKGLKDICDEAFPNSDKEGGNENIN